MFLYHITKWNRKSTKRILRCKLYGFYLYQHFKRTNSLKPGFEVHFLTFSKPFEAGRRRKLTRCFKEFNIYLLYLLYWCMTFVDLFEFCNRKASNLCLGRATTRSHSSQWSKKKSCSWNIKTHYLRFKHFIITITDDPSPC
jgi:hypothetical protein